MPRTITRTLEHRDPKTLKNHPLNLDLYGDTPEPEFVERIGAIGVLEPLTILADGTVISGHRRRQAAVINELKSVPVIVRRDLTDPLEIEEALIEANRQREKTVEQRAREYERLKEIEAERAKQRQKTSTGGSQPQLVPNLPQAGKTREKRPKLAQKAPENGKARDLAAEAVGLSATTAERAVEVVHAIDQAEASGDTETAEELRETLNHQSVSAAHRKVSKPPKAGRETFNFAAVESHIGKLARMLDDQLKAFPATKKHHAACKAPLNELLKAWKQWRKEVQRG